MGAGEGPRGACKYMIVGNVGDSVCVLSRNGIALKMSDSHLLTRPDELALPLQKLAALAPHPKVLAQLGGDEEQLEVMMKNEQLVVDGEPILGPHGTRALCTALMGNAPGMSGAVFKMCKNFRCDLRVLRCCGAFTLSM